MVLSIEPPFSAASTRALHMSSEFWNLRQMSTACCVTPAYLVAHHVPQSVRRHDHELVARRDLHARDGRLCAQPLRQRPPTCVFRWKSPKERVMASWPASRLLRMTKPLLLLSGRSTSLFRPRSARWPCGRPSGAWPCPFATKRLACRRGSRRTSLVPLAYRAPTAFCGHVDRAAGGADVPRADELQHGLHLRVGVLHQLLGLVEQVLVKLGEELFRLACTVTKFLAMYSATSLPP